MTITLTTAEKLQIRTAAERLKRRFEGQLNTETIERFINESLDTLVQRAHTSTWIPLLAERFARDRLRALVRLESDAATLNPSVLFLCVHNAGRSQMAAGWMRHLADNHVDVFTGGSEPADQVNQAARYAGRCTAPAQLDGKERHDPFMRRSPWRNGADTLHRYPLTRPTKDFDDRTTFSTQDRRLGGARQLQGRPRRVGSVQPS